MCSKYVSVRNNTTKYWYFMCFRKSFKWPVKFSLKSIMSLQCPFNADLKPLVRTQENVPVTFLFIHTHSFKNYGSICIFISLDILIDNLKKEIQLYISYFHKDFLPMAIPTLLS